MKSPDELWTEYRNAIYGPSPLPAVQEKETRQAFYAGLLSMIAECNDVATKDLTDEQYSKQMWDFMDKVSADIKKNGQNWQWKYHKPKLN